MFKISNNYKLKILKKFSKINNPKISIISPVFNSENFILRFLRSIQNQNFNELEIIFIDDFSIDNSIEIVQNYKSQDERIILSF
jgi:teichuronic acid biosynthesis glycosyltransferase TuaG